MITLDDLRSMLSSVDSSAPIRLRGASGTVFDVTGVDITKTVEIVPGDPEDAGPTTDIVTVITLY